jgi:hypothetical protein
MVAGRQCPRVAAERSKAPDQRSFVSARHKKHRGFFTQNRKLSRITVAMAGVTVIVPAAVAASMATSGGTTKHGTSLLAMAGTQSTTGSAAASLDVGTPITGAARREVGSLGARRVIAERAVHKAAEKAADRRAAERAARRRAGEQQAAQTATTQQGSGSSGSSAPRPSGSPQHIAMAMLGSYGWSSSQFGCLDSLWNAESGWNVYASNPSSGAYGIPQALPGAKMASAGPAWQSDAATQIRWGLGYIKGLYSSPCGAWAHEEADGWY